MVYKESEVYMYDSEDGFPGKDSNRVQDEHFGSQCVKLSEFVNRSKIPSLLRNYADMLTGRLQESSQNTEYSHRA